MSCHCILSHPLQSRRQNEIVATSAVTVTLLYPSFDFLLNTGIFCWLNPSFFFFFFFPPLGQLSGLLGNSCRYFFLLPVSQKMCSRWRPGSIPPRGLNALTFHTQSLPGCTQKSISDSKAPRMIS